MGKASYFDMDRDTTEGETRLEFSAGRLLVIQTVVVLIAGINLLYDKVLFVFIPPSWNRSFNFWNSRNVESSSM
jgi:hypothetical protein